MKDLDLTIKHPATLCNLLRETGPQTHGQLFSNHLHANGWTWREVGDNLRALEDTGHVRRAYGMWMLMPGNWRWVCPSCRESAWGDAFYWTVSPGYAQCPRCMKVVKPFKVQP